MRVVIAGGGTGGHLFPGVALAEAFGALEGGAEVVFVGAERGLESRVIPSLGYRLVALPVRGVMGTGFWRGALRGMGLLLAMVKASGVLARQRTELVVGVGGYASVPAVLAAWLMRVPRCILEQNLVPGRANRLLARFAQRVYVGFPEAAAHFPAGRTVVSGNPIRGRALAPDRDRRDESGGRTLLILGGSQGAAQLNDLALSIAPDLLRRHPDLKVIHQTGQAHLEKVRGGYASSGVKAEVVPFISEMGAVYGRADLCLSRSGAMAVTEMAAAGLPAVFIPFPDAVGGHQKANARWLEERGGAVLVDPERITPAVLLDELDYLLSSSSVLSRMAEASRAAGSRDAAGRIVAGEMERLGKGKGKGKGKGAEARSQEPGAGREGA